MQRHSWIEPHLSKKSCYFWFFSNIAPILGSKVHFLRDFLNWTISSHSRQDTFDNFAFEIEEDAISHYTATTEISEETYEDDPENNISNNKKRNKIRTNPHIKGGTLEKKAKNRKNRHKRKKSRDLDDQNSTKSTSENDLSDYYTEPENELNEEETVS